MSVLTIKLHTTYSTTRLCTHCNITPLKSQKLHGVSHALYLQMCLVCVYHVSHPYSCWCVIIRTRKGKESQRSKSAREIARARSTGALPTKKESNGSLLEVGNRPRSMSAKAAHPKGGLIVNDENEAPVDVGRKGSNSSLLEDSLSLGIYSGVEGVDYVSTHSGESESDLGPEVNQTTNAAAGKLESSSSAAKIATYGKYLSGQPQDDRPCSAICGLGGFGTTRRSSSANKLNPLGGSSRFNIPIEALPQPVKEVSNCPTLFGLVVCL